MKNCAFVMPVYIDTSDLQKLKFFEITLNSIFSQSDDDWILIIIDDNSNNRVLSEMIEKNIKKWKDKIVYHKNDVNLGPGISRNIGIEIASKMNCKYILFQDADDIADVNRVKITKATFDDSEADVVYSTFIPIDENGEVIDENKLSFSIKDILEANKNNSPNGKDIWKRIAIETGYINMTSSTSVRIKYALKVKFPDSRASEDAYVWMVYSALGANYQFVKEIPCKYRIPQNTIGSSSRSYVGKDTFYMTLFLTNEKAFYKCLELAEKNQRIDQHEKERLITGFYKKICCTLEGEGMIEISTKIKERIKKKSLSFENYQSVRSDR